ncbi:MAG: hypothetical protein C0469_06980 [Cyanobacteria bacterium DS2.3.42]|nr:hypothetical protein [Cyanobacteria bacterium DS2.3.42]
MSGKRLRQRSIILEWLLAPLLLVACGLSLVVQAQRNAVLINPHVTVWAWERDEDLSYIDPAEIDVAYFAGNIYVRGSLVSFRPRVQRLKLPKNAKTIPVFRIETIRGGAVSSSSADSTAVSSIKRFSNKGFSTPESSIPNQKAAEFVARTITGQLKKLQKLQPSQMVQIDFDALEDERPFYKTLLRNLRQELPPATKISITALASWLLADRWIEPGSADEAVAMLFSIGPGKRDVLSRLKKQTLDSGAGVPIAIGISANEGETNRMLFPTEVQRKTDNLYIFSSRPWTEKRLRAITYEAIGK